jgi:hypothetical protein
MFSISSSVNIKCMFLTAHLGSHLGIRGRRKERKSQQQMCAKDLLVSCNDSAL